MCYTSLLIIDWMLSIGCYRLDVIDWMLSIGCNCGWPNPALKRCNRHYCTYKVEWFYDFRCSMESQHIQ